MTLSRPWQIAAELARQNIMDLAVVTDISDNSERVVFLALAMLEGMAIPIENGAYTTGHPDVDGPVTRRASFPFASWHGTRGYEILSIANTPTRALSVAIHKLCEYNDEIKWITDSVAHAKPIVDPELRKAIIARDGGKCVYCGKKAILADHLHPRATGGTDAKNNLVAACWRCNSTKSDAAWHLWYRAQQFYAQERAAYIEGIMAA